MNVSDRFEDSMTRVVYLLGRLEGWEEGLRLGREEG